MAQTYTIDEAAERLGIAPDDFKKRLKDEWKSIRSFRDGPTLRFRAADIDELARTLGEASDLGLQLGAPGSAPQSGSSDEFLIPPDATPTEPEPESLSGDDIFGTPPSRKPKTGSDSDVRLELRGSRMADDDAVPTEEIALDLSDPGSAVKRAGGSSARLRAPKSGPNLSGPGSSKTKIPGPPPSSAEPMSTDSSSEFELSLDADSGSFELQLGDGSSEEVEIGSPVLPPGGRGAQSGINLGKPTDSGVSLENRPGADADDSDDFELSLEPASDDTSSRKISTPPSARIPKMAVDSDSEFELTLDDNSGVTDNLARELAGEDDSDEDKRDIFETDFELPAVSDDAESGSEVVAIEGSDTDLENSDFDLALDEQDAVVETDDSGSEVVALEDSDESPIEDDEPTTTGRSGRALAGAGAAAVGAAAARRRAARDDEDEEEDPYGVQDRGGVREVEVAAKSTEWGPLPAALLIPCLVLTFLGGIISFETIKGMSGYSQGGKPGGSIARGVADLVGFEIKD